MTAEIVKIPFKGSFIYTAYIDDRPVVVVKPTIESMGIDPKTQIDKLRTRSWGVTRLCPATGSDGKTYQMVTVDLDTWSMLLANINENLVKPELRPTVIAYQLESKKVLYKYWAEGMAPINPRLEPDQIPEVATRVAEDYQSARQQFVADEVAERSGRAVIATRQIELLGSAMALDLIDAQWAKTASKLVVSRGLGVAPEVPKEDLPLYVEDFLKSKGVPPRAARNYCKAFGARLQRQASADEARIPGKRPQMMADGKIRDANAWTQADRPLFERTWIASDYANNTKVMGY